MDVPFGVGYPVWVDDVGFDIARHVHLTRLPAPGRRRVLLELADRLMAQLLDRSRPLWELWFVAGLDDGRHVGLVHKSHHTLTDGISGVDIATGLLDFSRDPTVLDPPPFTPDPPPDPARLMLDTLCERVAQPAGIVHAGRRAADAPQQVVEQAGRLARSFGALVGGGPLAPKTSLNTSVGPRRHLELVRIPLDVAKGVRHAFGCTVNDVVLAACGGALARLLEARGELRDDLVLKVVCPVSVRDDGDRMKLGNRLSLMFVPLPVGQPDARARLDAVAASTVELKEREQALGAATLLGISEYAAPTILGLAAARGARAAAREPDGHERPRSAGAALLLGRGDARGLPDRAAHEEPQRQHRGHVVLRVPPRRGVRGSGRRARRRAPRGCARGRVRGARSPGGRRGRRGRRIGCRPMAHDADPTVEVTGLLQSLIRNRCVNDGTVASGEERRSVDLLADYLHGAGDHEVYEPRPGRQSLLCRLEGSDPAAPSLMLLGHTDVVPVTPEGWSRDPFSGDVVDGLVWGRGAVDMLNLTASQAVAFRRLVDSGFRPQGTLLFLAVADEESQGVWGADWLLEHERDAVFAEYVITESGGIQVPTSAGVAAPDPRGREGHVLVEDPRARDARTRVAAAADRQRARDGRARRAAHRRLPARGTDPRRVASLRRRHALRSGARRVLLDPDAIDDALDDLPVGLARTFHACTAYDVRADDRARWHQDQRDPRPRDARRRHPHAPGADRSGRVRDVARSVGRPRRRGGDRVA